MKMFSLAFLATLMTVMNTAKADGSYDDDVLTASGWPTQFDKEKPAEDSELVVDLSSDVSEIEKDSALTDNQKAIENLQKTQDELEKAKALNAQLTADHQRQMEEYMREHEAQMQEADALRQQQLSIAEESAENAKKLLKRQQMEEAIDPNKVRFGIVTVNAESATIKEIAEALMPEGWRVKTDFSTPKGVMLDTARFTFTTTDQRDTALRKLVSSVPQVRVNYQYFFDLVEDGVPSPMLIISDKKRY